jgi:hypothetical protein
VEAWLALATRDPRFDGDELPQFQTTDGTPQPYDTGRELVTHDDRLLHYLGADAAVLVVVHVGAADPDTGDLQQYFIGTRRGARQFLQPEVADAVQERGAHGR